VQAAGFLFYPDVARSLFPLLGLPEAPPFSFSPLLSCRSRGSLRAVRPWQGKFFPLKNHVRRSVLPSADKGSFSFLVFRRIGAFRRQLVSLGDQIGPFFSAFLLFIFFRIMVPFAGLLEGMMTPPPLPRSHSLFLASQGRSKPSVSFFLDMTAPGNFIFARALTLPLLFR